MSATPAAAEEHDLFGEPVAPPTLVRLDRSIDRQHPCCDNLAVAGPGKAQHAAELRCAACNKHRGWVPKAALDFLTATAQRFGAPAEPMFLRDTTIGDHVMAKASYDDSNRGALFRNSDKQKDSDRDYSGAINVDGREFWLSGWLKTSSKGTKFLSLSVKPKDETNKPKPSTTADFNDEIPL